MLRNIGSNIVGTILPSVAALIAVPLLIGHLGIGLFGIFSLQIAALFFFGLADFGIARAIVLLSFDEPFRSDAMGWLRPYRIGLRYSLMLGVSTAILALPIGLSLFWFWSPKAVDRGDLAVSTALIFLSAGITLVSQAPRAVLEAQQRFFVANLIRGPAAAAIFIAPLAAFSVKTSLTVAAVSILLTRVLSVFCYFAAIGIMPGEASSGDPRLRRHFLHKAGWLGLTNVLSMLTAYLDRFVLGFLGSAAAVGQYVIAQEVVTKLWIAIGAVTSAATPRLASQRDQHERGAFRRSIRQMTVILIIAGLLPSALLIVFGGFVLELWLGASFEAASVAPLGIMAVGLGINALSQLNFTLLQVYGGERRTASLQVLNLVFSALALPPLIALFGINGAAIAFSARLLLDAFLVRAFLSGLRDDCKKVGVGNFGLIAAAAVLIGLLLVT